MGLYDVTVVEVSRVTSPYNNPATLVLFNELYQGFLL